MYRFFIHNVFVVMATMSIDRLERLKNIFNISLLAIMILQLIFRLIVAPPLLRTNHLTQRLLRGWYAQSVFTITECKPVWNHPVVKFILFTTISWIRYHSLRVAHQEAMQLLRWGSNERIATSGRILHCKKYKTHYKRKGTKINNCATAGTR